MTVTVNSIALLIGCDLWALRILLATAAAFFSFILSTAQNNRYATAPMTSICHIQALFMQSRDRHYAQ